MAASYGAGGQSPPVIGRPVDRVFEDAQFTGEVNLSGRKLKDYPKICTKYDLADTIHTDLSKNRFGEMPTEVCDYCNMERLNCYHNIIKSIPEAIVQLQALTHLNLSRNQLTVLPVSLCALSSLEVLLASNNKLVSLPEEIGKLERLMDLDVSCNEISHLPPQIGDLRCLRSLNLRRNLLVELPLDICKLNLRRLDIASNRVQKIPTVFRKLEVLEEIILEHNPLESPPAHICTRGRQHIMKYLHQEAIKEDRKRGILSDSDMKRLIRKSLPPQHPCSGKERRTSDEFRQMLEAPEAKWKRHTVLSSDSGYSTADSLDKCGWNHSELGVMGGGGVGSGGEVCDENSMLAFKAAEAVREQRQQSHHHHHNNNNHHHHNSNFNAHVLNDLARARLHPHTAAPASPTLNRSASPLPGGRNVSSASPQTVPVMSVTSPRDFSQVSVSPSSFSPTMRTPPSPLMPRYATTPPSPLAQRHFSPPPLPSTTTVTTTTTPPSPLPQRHSNHHHHHHNHQPLHQRQNAYPPAPSHYHNHAPPPLSSLSSVPHNNVSPQNFYASSHGSSHSYREDGQGGGGGREDEGFPPPPAPLALVEEEELTPPVTPPTPLGRQVMSITGSLEDEFARIFQELQRQKHEYEQRKKAAEQIRLVQEEKEREERQRAAQKLQEEQRLVMERQREDQQRKEAERIRQQQQEQEEQQRAMEQQQRAMEQQQRAMEQQQRALEEQRLLQEQARQEEEARLREEARRQEEERLRAEAKQQEEEYKNKPVNKNALSSQSAKDQRRVAGGAQYRRAASDSITQKRGIPTAVNNNSHSSDSLNNHINKNGVAEDDHSSLSPPHSTHNPKSTTPTNPSHPGVWRLQGGGERASSPVQSPVSRRSKPPERSSVPTPTSARSVSRTSSTSSVNSVQSQGSSTARGPPHSSSTTPGPSSSGGPRTKNHPTPTSTPKNVRRAVGRIEEEFRSRHQQVKVQHQVESQRLKSRLEDHRSKATATPSAASMGAKRPGVADSDNKRQSAGGRAGATTAARTPRQVLSAGAMKMLEEYKDTNPNFTIRRREEHHREENQQLEMLRQTIECRLKVTLPDNLPEALRDGVVLCHLANQIRPRSVASIHVPSPAVPKLTLAKCRRNVENFLDACRKIGVDQAQLCVATDIMEERGVQRVALTVASLVALGSNPRQSAV